MARYNTVISSATASTTAAFTSPGSGAFTKLTGTTYTVTIGDPVLFSGQSQTFYNAASGTITLSFSTGGGGVFTGPGGSGSTNQTMPTGTTVTVYSDGTNWVLVGGSGGGPLTATTGSFSSDVTLTGATPTLNLNNSNPTITTNSSSSTANIFNTNVTTLNIGAAATTIAIGNNTGTTTLKGTLSFAGSSSGTVKFVAAAAAGSTTYTWPSADAAASGYSLVSNGSGTLSWSQTSATITATSSASTFYPVIASSTSGSLTTANVVSSGFSFVPSTGTLTVTALTESSSITLKENVTPIDNALDAILQLVGVTYDRRDGSSKGEAGLIAEEVNKIIPNIVSKDKDGNPEGIHYTKITAYLVEAIKSLKTEINALKGI